MSSIPVKKDPVSLSSAFLSAVGAFSPAAMSAALHVAQYPPQDALIGGGILGGLLAAASFVTEGKKNIICSGAFPGTVALLAGPVVASAGESISQSMSHGSMNLMSWFKGACAAASCAVVGGSTAISSAAGEKWREKKRIISGALAGAAGTLALSTALTFGEDMVSPPAPEISVKPITVRMEPVASLANRIPG